MQINLDPEAIRRSVEQHADEPQISIREHIRRLCLGLGKSIECRRAVYLDTRYWIFLRDVMLDEPQKRIHVALLDELEQRVMAGCLFCPISDATFLELLKQTRPESRRATAEIVDRLSLGISLCGEQQRMFTEIYYLLRRADKAANLAPIWQMVWVRLAYALGISYPSHTPFPAQTEVTLQKAFTDCLWNMPLADIVQVLDGSVPPGDSAAIAERLNISNAEHSDEVGDFHSTYLSELTGSLELFAQFATDMVEGQMRAGGMVVDASTSARRGRERMAHGVLVSAAGAGKGIDAFPTLHAHAKCHAAIRRDKRRRLDGNDLFDFHHALGALVYCDAFFTDHPLRVFLTTNPLALDAEFRCRVISDEAAALEYVRQVD